MAPRPTGRRVTPGSGRAGYSALPLAVLCLALLFFPARVAKAQEAGPLEGSGIHYPGGFDPNTVGELHGTARDFHRPERGPVRFLLDTGAERYTVLVSPAWYWEDVGAEAPEGAKVVVRGSKTLGKDMEMYVIAQDLRVVSTGQSWAFRDADGYPIWKGAGVGAGRGGGAGSQMLRGGAGRGAGGGGGRGGR